MSGLCNRRRVSSFNRRKGQQGAQTIEILIVIPLLFSLVFVVLEFTNILRTYETVVWTAEFGVREASDGMESGSHNRLSPSSVRDIIFDKAVALGIKNLDKAGVCIQYSSDDGATWEPASVSSCTSPEGSYGPGDLVRVTIRLTYQPFLPRLLVPEISLGVTLQRVISI